MRTIVTTTVALTLLVLLLAATSSEAKKSSKALNLPDCNAARKSYKAGKLYDVFGLDKKASDKDIRKAFKKMSVKCHPDKDRDSKHANDNFIAIGAAYETLSNEQERAHYDATGTTGGTPGANPYTGAGGRQTWNAKDFGDIDLTKIFSKFFTSGGGQAGGDDDDSDFMKMFGGGFNFGGGGRGPSPSRQGQQKKAGNSGNFAGNFANMFGGAGNMFGGGGTGRKASAGSSGSSSGSGSSGKSKSGSSSSSSSSSSSGKDTAAKKQTTTASTTTRASKAAPEAGSERWAKAEQTVAGSYSFVNKNRKARSKNT